MEITEANTFFRALQLIPLICVFLPILKSYWQRKNQINGLRKTRFTLIILLIALIFSNIYFLIFSLFKISRAIPQNQIFVIIDKIVNLFAYWLLFYLFKHAAQHNKK